MGKIIKLENRVLVPTQDILLLDNKKYLKSISKIFWTCYEDKIEEIPIFPVQQDHRNKNYLLVLDGHHKAAMYDLFGITPEIYVFLAESRMDKMPEIFPKQNNSLTNLFDENLLDAKSTMNYNIETRWGKFIYALYQSPKTFTEFRQKYPCLKDIDSAKKYFEKFKS